MWGAIAGDIAGSIYECNPTKRTDLPIFAPGCKFTDDTVMTLAVAHAILEGRGYAECMVDIGNKYPRCGYGRNFKEWLKQWEPEPYYSCGNGSAMRVSPIGWAFETEKEVLEEAKKSAEVSHNHPEGIKGAQAVALGIFLLRNGSSKENVRSELAERFGYDLNRSLDEIRPGYSFDVTCQGSVPEAIIAFLESDSVESAISNAISLGGDADTQACIAGALAESAYGFPETLKPRVLSYLPPDLAAVLHALDNSITS